MELEHHPLEGWDNLPALLEGDQREPSGAWRHTCVRTASATSSTRGSRTGLHARRHVIAPARRVAYDVVLRVFEEDAYADRAFAGAAAGLDARDRALAQRIAYGTVQRARTLDHALKEVGRRPMRKLDPPVRAALRIGAYQLGYLDAVPAYAAVGESVELVRAAGLERAVKFTNAVLRRFTLGHLAERTPEEAALAHSYPDWVAETWWREGGRRRRSRSCAPRTSRLRRLVRLVRGEIEGEPHGHSRARTGSSGSTSRRSRTGCIWPQSRGSQLAGLAVGSREGERTLDLCAAPGGKATMLAGEVVAVEKHPGRARELEENARRLGAANVTVVRADGLALPPELTRFDRALVDAPCSGLGILASRPDARWRAEPLPSFSWRFSAPLPSA